MFPPVSAWKAPDLSSLPSWEGQPLVSMDTEFRDATLRKYGCGARRGAEIAGYSFAFQDGFKAYIPIRHPEGNVDCVQGLNYARDNAKHFKGKLLGAHLTIDVDMMNNEKLGPILFPQIQGMSDVLVNDPLIYELNQGYGLEDVAHRRGFEGKDETMLKDAAGIYGADTSKKTWKAIVPDLPAKYVGPYGEEDAWLPIPIYFKQREIAEAEGLIEIFDLEGAVTPVLLKMRQRGVLIDFDHLAKVDAWAHTEERETLDKMFHVTGYRIHVGDTMKTNACVPAFAACGVQVPMTRDPKTKKLKYSLDKEFLAKISEPETKKFEEKSKHAQAAVLFLYARQMAKLYGTFCKQVRDYSTNGRLHTTFRQIIGANEKNEKSGAAFGRLSSAKPNLQQQPSRAKYANFFRQIYLPEPGTEWGCLDYSCQEPRWTIHFANVLGLKGADKIAAEYRSNVRIDPHQAMADLVHLPRKDSKIVFLALCYGEGGAKLCKNQLGLPTRWAVRYRDSGKMEYFESKGQAVKARKEYDGEASYYEVAGAEGQAILDTFNSGAPYIKALAKMAERRAASTGKIRLLGGRVVNFPQDHNGQYQWSYKALNRLIQGTSGMQMKMAMVEIARSMPEVFIQLAVHDELDGSFTSVKQMKDVAQIMRTVAGQTHVPFRIDIEKGRSWGELHQVCGDFDCHELIAGEKISDYYCAHHESASKVAA